MKFEDYFSFEAILGDLVKWRLAGKDVGGTLPPRAEWKRGGFRERKERSAEDVRRAAIIRAVQCACGGGHAGRVTLPSRDSCAWRAMTEKRWASALLDLVDKVRHSVFAGSVEFEKPRKIRVPKGYKDGRMVYREVASFDRLADRVILSRMTAYVRDVRVRCLVPGIRPASARGVLRV